MLYISLNALYFHNVELISSLQQRQPLDIHSLETMREDFWGEPGEEPLTTTQRRHKLEELLKKAHDPGTENFTFKFAGSQRCENYTFHCLGLKNYHLVKKVKESVIRGTLPLLCCHALLNIMLNVQCPTSDPRSLDILCVVSLLVSTRLKLQRIMWGHVNRKALLYTTFTASFVQCYNIRLQCCSIHGF